ncbi:MAG: hypothetical protein P1U32_08305 [Legionellaceae bacterium]|nr:hypothetical protein [Legionellaceae bacterium]
MARTQGISETPMWVVPDKLQCISTTPDFDALQHWVSDQIVKKDAVARIERFFAASLEKKATVSESEQDLSSGPPI